jgi:uncharacterized protein
MSDAKAAQRAAFFCFLPNSFEQQLNMSANLSSVLREIHRLRRHLRDLRSQVEGLPRLKKAHQAKVARHEQLVKDAHDNVKRLKSANHEREVDLKATHQLLSKYERQLNDMTTPKEIEAMQHEIADARVRIGKLEEEILNGMTEIDEFVAKVPAIDELLKKAKAELANFDADAKDREDRLNREAKLAQVELQKVEEQVPPPVRTQLDRLIKAHGADALAGIKERDRTCSQCLMTITVSGVHELRVNHLVCCNNCGRVLYLEPEEPAGV